MLGFINFYLVVQIGWFNDYYEFVQGWLSEFLVEGVVYEVSFWVSWQVEVFLQYFRIFFCIEFIVLLVLVVSNNIGIVFLCSFVDFNEFFDQFVWQFNIWLYFNVDIIVGDSVMMWIQVKGIFKVFFVIWYFVIGNFFKDV